MARILLIGHSGDMYGASRSLAKLSYILSSAGHEVFVLLPEEGPLHTRLLEIIPEENIIIKKSLFIFTRKSFKFRYLGATVLLFSKNIRNITAIIKTHKIDIVHTNSGVVPAGALAAKIMGKKHIWHIREWFGDFKGFWPFYRSYMINLSDKIIGVSQSVTEQFKNSKKAVSVYNGFVIPDKINAPLLDSSMLETLSTADLIIGCTSRIRLIRKGQEFLIEAVGMLTNSTEKNIQIILVGDFVPGYEDQRHTLQALIEKFGLQNRVHFLGHVSDALPYYSLFDLFVLPSGEPEPFGGVVMEAMSTALPVIGSNLGGTTEQVKDGWNGYLFENQNSIDLAEKINLFLIEKEKLKEFGVRSIDRINSNFSMDIHRSRILEIYNSI